MIKSFPSFEELRPLIELARAEDLGLPTDDVTSRLMVAADATGVGTIVQKEAGVVCGLPLVEMICREYALTLRVEQIAGMPVEAIEGRFNDTPMTPLVRVCGPLRSLLSAERVMLNFLQRLSGIATLTRQFVQQVQGTGARIYDTRKTTPGLRALEKYAVRSGGGHNHRMGLYDGLLVKDNHLAHLPMLQIAPFLTEVAGRSRGEAPGRFIEVEVDNLEQLEQVLTVEGIDCILLDNMDCPHMAEAVALRDKAGKKGKVSLEASGGVTLKTVRAIAMAGVDRIAVGALTHSARALDIGLEVQ